MPRPRTQAEFLEYQLSIRPHATRGIVLAEWRAKSANERSDWLTARRAAKARSDEVDALLDAADDAADNVDDAILPPFIRNLDEWTDLRASLRVARPLWENLKAAQILKKDAWHNLRLLEVSHPRSNAISIGHATANFNQAEADRVNCDTRLTQFRDLLRSPPVAADANGVERIPRLWVERAVANEDRFLRARDVQGYDPDEIGLPHPGTDTWVSAADVSGGMGSAHIWVQHDANNRIRDRLFRKDVVMSENDWHSPKRWAGDVRNPTTKWPYEIACHFAIQGVPNVQNVARTRGCQHRGLVFDDSCRYRLYLEYARNGDLRQLIEFYSHRNDNPPTPDYEEQHIPEAMIWNVAEALAECGQAMVVGALGGGVNVAWEEIVHRDLKPSNVVLDGADTRHPYYPKPALTDFGLAFMTPNPDPNNPHWYNNSTGTPRFLAPEQQRWIDRNNLQPVDEHELREPTNVFGVGLILYCLITLETNPPETAWIGDASRNKTLYPPKRFPAREYSVELRNLVWQCLQFEPGDRPSFNDILNQVAHQINTDNVLRDMRNGTADAATQDAHAVSRRQERYALNSIWP